MDTQQQQWPNRRAQILGATVPIGVLSIVVLLWRVVYGIKTKRKLLICDYLLILAAMMNIVTTVLRFITTAHGLGRHIKDPSISKPHDILQFSYFLWITQIINLLAVAVLKYSICAYLLALKFSKVYMIIIWASILMVTIFNLTIPILSVFACTPLEANWNRTMKRNCFMKGGLLVSYSQGVSNIITDVVYVVAPIIYLSTIKLPRRTQWGLRVVFCLGLIATACSIMKTIELKALMKTKDPTWDGVNLTIWSATELSVGILIASLPPLRKQFDKFFRTILPTTWPSARSNSKSRSNIAMYTVSKQHTTRNRLRERSRKGDGDDDSERGILPVEEGVITKTVVHKVLNEARVEGVQMPTGVYSTH